MRRILVALIVAAVVLSGCNGPLDSGSQTSSPTSAPTSSPTSMPTPTQTSTSTPSPTPTTCTTNESAAANPDLPGVTDGTLTNATALVERNADALDDTSYEMVARSYSANPSSPRLPTVLVSNATVRAEAGGAPYHVTTSYPGYIGLSTDNQWGNGTLGLSRQGPGADTGMETALFTRHDTPARLDHARYVRGIAGLAGVVTFEAGSETGGGAEGCTTLQAVSYDESAPEMENVTDVSGRIVVDDDGRIRSYAITINKTENGVSESATEEYELTRIGDVSVDRPSWVETALEETGKRSIVADAPLRTAIAVTHTGSEVVENGTKITLEGDSAAYDVRLERAFEPGDDVHLMIDAETDELLVSRSMNTSGKREFPVGTYTVGISSSDGETTVGEANVTVEEAD